MAYDAMEEQVVLNDDRIKDLEKSFDNWFNESVQKAKKQALTFIGKLMTKYDETEVFDYINSRRKSKITNITDEEKSDLDTAINTLNLSYDEDDIFIEELDRIKEETKLRKKIERKEGIRPEDKPTEKTSIKSESSPVEESPQTSPGSETPGIAARPEIQGGYHVGDRIEYVNQFIPSEDLYDAQQKGRKVITRTYGSVNTFSKKHPVYNGIVVGFEDGMYAIIAEDELSEWEKFVTENPNWTVDDVNNSINAERFTIEYIDKNDLVGKSSATTEEIEAVLNKQVEHEMGDDLGAKVGDIVEFTHYPSSDVNLENEIGDIVVIDANKDDSIPVDDQGNKRYQIEGKIKGLSEQDGTKLYVVQTEFGDFEREFIRKNLTKQAIANQAKDNERNNKQTIRGKVKKVSKKDGYTLYDIESDGKVYTTRLTYAPDDSGGKIVESAPEVEEIRTSVDSLRTEALGVLGKTYKNHRDKTGDERFDATYTDAKAELLSKGYTETDVDAILPKQLDVFKGFMAKRNKINATVADLYNVIDKDEKGYTTEYKKAVRNFVDAYLESVGKSKINGKRVINANALIRYAKQIIGNNEIVNNIVSDLLDYLVYENNLTGRSKTIILTDTKDELNKAKIIALSDKSFEETYLSDNQKGTRIDIWDAPSNERQKLEKLKVLRTINNGDKLDYRISNTGKVIEIIKDDVVIGILPIPKYDEKTGTFYKENDGWLTDIQSVNGKIQSNFVEFLKQILGDFNSPLYKLVAEYTYGEEKNNETIIKAFANNSLLIQAKRTFANPKASNEQLLRGLSKLLQYTSKAATEEEVISSLDSWAETLLQSYNEVHALLSGNEELVVDYITEGELIHTSREEEYNPVQTAVANLSDKTHKIAVGVTGGVMIISGAAVSADGNVETTGWNDGRSKIYKGRTLLTIPNRSGSPSYINVRPTNVRSQTLSNEGKELMRAIKTAMRNHIVNGNFEGLKKLIFSIFRSKENPSSFFHIPDLTKINLYEAFVTNSALGHEVIGIRFGEEKTDVILFDINNWTYSIKHKSGQITDFNDINFANNILNQIFENFRFLVNDDLVKSDSYENYRFNNSIVSKKDGKFIISFDKGNGDKFYAEYSSFTDFLIKTNAIDVATHIDPETGTNFKMSDDRRTMQRMYIKRVPKVISPVERTTIPTNDFKPIINKIIGNPRIKNASKAIIDKLINRNKKLNNLFGLDIWTNNIIFVEENLGVDARTDAVTGQITVGLEFIELANTKPRAAAKRIIHENLHSYFVRNREKANTLVKQVESVHKEFVESLTDEHIKEYAEKHGYDFEKAKTQLQRLINPYDNTDANVEELIVESMTNRFVSDYLNETESKQKGTSILAKLWQYLLDFLGVKINDGSLLAAEANALAGQISAVNVKSKTNTNRNANPSTGEQLTINFDETDDITEEAIVTPIKKELEQKSAEESTNTEIKEEPTQPTAEEIKKGAEIYGMNSEGIIDLDESDYENDRETEMFGENDPFNMNATVEDLVENEGYTDEMLSIRDKAILNGSYMKAPNGKSTNLTERQWLQVRTKAFKNWFGDWINDPTNASKVVDENGEPLVVYHGTEATISVFDKSKNTKGYWETPNGEKIPYDTENTFFFTDNKASARAYPLMRYMTGSEISNIGLPIINELLEAKKAVNRISEDGTIDSKYSKIINDALKTYSYKTNYRAFSGDLIVRYSELQVFKYTIDGYKSEKLPKELIGEAIKAIQIVLDEEIKYWNKDRTDWDGRKIPKIDLNEDVYSLFLNIKNPFVFDYEGKPTGGKYKDKYPIKYINARQVKKALEDGYDGVIYRNIADPYLMTSYGAFNPNQVKSATDNIGNFSKESDDIRNATVEDLSEENAPANVESFIQSFDQTAKPIVRSAIARGEFNIHCL